MCHFSTAPSLFTVKSDKQMDTSPKRLKTRIKEQQSGEVLLCGFERRELVLKSVL